MFFVVTSGDALGFAPLSVTVAADFFVFAFAGQFVTEGDTVEFVLVFFEVVPGIFAHFSAGLLTVSVSGVFTGTAAGDFAWLHYFYCSWW